MKKLFAFLIAFTLLTPMVILACHCCPAMKAPAHTQDENSIGRLCNSVCCQTFEILKESAPKIEKFVHSASDAAINFFGTKSAETDTVVSKEIRQAGPPEISGSPQVPLYLSLSIIRI